MPNNSKTLNEQIYKKIKYDIMDLVMLPGEQVSVQKLADRYETTRAPIQVAMVRLQNEGLVKAYPKSRTEISRIDLKRMNEEWFMRRTLEPAVMDEFCDRYEEKDLTSLMEIYREQAEARRAGDLTQFYRLDNRMHKLFYTVADKTLIWDTIDETATHYNRLRILSAQQGGIGSIIMDEHKVLIEDIKKRDRGKIKTLLVEHLDHAFAQVNQLKEQYPDYFTSQEGLPVE